MRIAAQHRVSWPLAAVVVLVGVSSMFELEGARSHRCGHLLVPQVGSVSDVFIGARFQINVPVSFLKTEHTTSSQVDWGRKYAFDQFHEPHVIVRLQASPSSLEDALSEFHGDRIERYSVTPDGYAMTSRVGNEMIRTYRWIRLDDRESLDCYILQDQRSGIDDIDDTEEWFESICASLVLLR